MSSSTPRPPLSAQLTLEGKAIEIPKCHNCKKPLDSILERIHGEDITYGFDGNTFKELDTEHWGESELLCGYCEHQLNDAEREWVCEMKYG